jgi:hypothetical protein
LERYDKRVVAPDSRREASRTKSQGTGGTVAAAQALLAHRFIRGGLDLSPYREKHPKTVSSEESKKGCLQWSTLG